MPPPRIDGIQYFNLTNAMNQQRIRTTRYLKNKTACCVCDRNIPVRCIKCREVLRKTQVLLQKRRKNKKIQEIYTSPYCSRCGIYYISKLKYLGYQSLWEAVDERTLRKSVAEEEQIIKTRQQQKLRAQMTLRKRTQDHLSEKQMTREGKISQPQKAVGMKIEGNRKSSAECIELEDFVVRRTTFKCLHQHHTLQNVDANIGLIDRLGNIIQAKASAGYCEECKVFFIMESTSQNLKLRGTPMCRISDEKAYMAREVVSNGMRLSQESILMQYGYSVSQTEGLSDARRRKILAVLVDNKVLTRSDVIGYLDFFISQRKHQHQYEKAIEKWESDREFIAHYKTGSYTEYKVNSISRRSYG